jgi:hypothetical protein
MSNMGSGYGTANQTMGVDSYMPSVRENMHATGNVAPSNQYRSIDQFGAKDPNVGGKTRAQYAR